MNTTINIAAEDQLGIAALERILGSECKRIEITRNWDWPKKASGKFKGNSCLKKALIKKQGRDITKCFATSSKTIGITKPLHKMRPAFDVFSIELRNSIFDT